MAKVGAVSITLSAHTKAFMNAMDKVATKTAKVAVSVHRLRKTFRRLGLTMANVRRQFTHFAGRALTGTIGALLRLRVVAFGTIGAFVGLASAGMVFARSLKLWAGFEQATVSLETFFNSAEKAKNLLNELVRFAAVTPFRFPEILQAARSLAAFGLEYEAILPTMRAIGDVAAGVNTDIRELAEAYGKVVARNQMMARNLIQFTLRGIPMVRELNKVLGTTGAELRRIMEEGKVSYAHMAQAFANMSGEGGQFFDLMKRQASTLGGLWSNLLDQLDIFMGLGSESFGARLEQRFKLKGVLAKTIIWLDEHREEFTKKFVDGLWKGFELLTNIITNLKPLLKGMFEMGITMATGFIAALEAIAGPLKEIATILGNTLGLPNKIGGGIASGLAWAFPPGGKSTGALKAILGLMGVRGLEEFDGFKIAVEESTSAVDRFWEAWDKFQVKMANLAKGKNPITRFFEETENAAFYANRLLQVSTQSLQDYLQTAQAQGLRAPTAALMQIEEDFTTLETAIRDFGKTKYELILDNIRRNLTGVSEGLQVVADAQRLVNVLTAKTQAADIVRDIAAWQEKQLSPFERYNRDIANYKRLLSEGALSVADFSSAMDMAYAKAQEEQAKLNKSVAKMSVQLAPAIMAGTAAAQRAQYRSRMQYDYQHQIARNVQQLVKVGQDQLMAQRDTTQAVRGTWPVVVDIL